MNNTIHNRIHRREQAFSLVEVVLAIAIIAIGLVAILGLFPQGLTSGQNASDDSLVAVIAQDVITRRKIDIQGNPAILGTSPGDSWFLPDGSETSAGSANTARYKCKVICAPVAGIANLESTRVEIVWPWFKPAGDGYSPLSTNVFVTEIAAYQ